MIAAAAGSARARTWLVALALAGSVLATYAAAGRLGFVAYDDPDYVLDNPPVRGGLSWAGLRWAFGAAHASNWHPLTWLAHMLDVELFGLAPAGHHWTSVLLHAANAVLCFHALRALTRRSWASACVAALFALHPLRVESVAWVSERKDVLAGSCFFLTLLAYARHARAPSAGRCALVAVCFVLGLMAKPMLVTLPVALLLLDVWPLKRVEFRKPFSAPPAGAPSPTPVSSGVFDAGRHPGECLEAPGRPSLYGLFLEKLPLLALSAASAVVTVLAQRVGGALYSLEALPLGERLANAPVAVLRYLQHFLLPAGLACFYPHPGLALPERPTPWTAGALAALALVALLTLGAALAFRRRPALAVGWGWFLVMLAPVIGVVQVGEQALADRYAYLPLVGVQIALVFGAAELADRRPALRWPLAWIALAALTACGWRSARQVLVWRNSETLYRNALAVTERNYAAHTGLADELATRGELDGARAQYELALAIRPSYAPALYSLGLLEQQHGDPERAEELYRRAAESLPGFAAAHLNLGTLLARRGAAVEAAQCFERVLEIFPAHPDAHFDLAQLLLAHGQAEEAALHLEAAVAARAEFGAAWEKLGEAREALGQHEGALEALERALGDPRRAAAARLSAWILATAAEPGLRDPARALELARRALQLTAGDAAGLEVLAAALAATDDFARAAEVQEEALRSLPPGQQAAARGRLELYRQGRTFVHSH